MLHTLRKDLKQNQISRMMRIKKETKTGGFYFYIFFYGCMSEEMEGTEDGIKDAESPWNLGWLHQIHSKRGYV